MAKSRFSQTSGPTQRQLRVAEVIRRAVSDALSRGDLYHDALVNVSVTVGEVRCSPDLRHATVFVCPLGGTNSDEIVAALNERRKEIRHIVTKSISLKYSPELKFLADTSFDQMDATRALFEREDVRRDVSSAVSDDGALD